MDRKLIILFLIIFYVFTYGIWIELFGINNPYRYFIYILILIPAFVTVFTKENRDRSILYFLVSMFLFMLFYLAHLSSDILSLYNYVFVPLVFFAGLYLLDSPSFSIKRKHFYQLLIMISLFGAVNSLVSIYEAFTNHLLLTSGSEHTIMGEYGEMRSRANGLIGSSLVNGCLCGISLLTSIHLYLQNKIKYIALFIAVISGVALLATLSRGPLVGTICGLIVLFWNRFKRISFLNLFLLVITCYLIINYLINSSDNSLLSTRIISIFNWKTDSGNTQRINVWTTALQILSDNTLLGMGIGALKELKIAVTESGVMYVFFETGIVGLVVYFTPLFHVIYRGYRFSRHKDPTISFCSSILTLILVENIVLQVMTSLVIQLTFGLFLAKIIIQMKTTKKSLIMMKT